MVNNHNVIDITDLVTVVITTYKRPLDIVKRAVQSVLLQTYRHLEIIIVDDSPSDYIGREFIINYFSKLESIVYIQHSHSQGACAARNTGLSIAKGKYIGYLDDDDEWKEYKIENQIKNFSNDKVALVYCGSEVFNDTDNSLFIGKSKFFRGNVFDKLIKGNFIGSTSFPLIKTEYLKGIGGFDIMMQSAQDYDVWLRLSELYEVSYTKLVCVRYHVHAGEQISTNHPKRISGQERLMLKNKDYLDNHKGIKAIRILKLSEEYLFCKTKKEVLNMWWTAFKLSPLSLINNLKYLLKIILFKKKK